MGKDDKNSVTWVAISADKEIREWLKKNEETLTFHSMLGLVAAWDGYIHGGRSELAQSRDRTAKKVLEAFIAKLEPHFKRRAWHQVEIRVMRILATELARQARKEISQLTS